MTSTNETLAERLLPDVSPRARAVTLGLLTATYFFSYLDRQILGILLEDIKLDLVLSDTQLGIISGLAFAIFYSTFGLPVAWLADRTNRRNLVSISLALWSGATALCGLATNFLHLLLARIGVGVGEAGSSPPSHSMIADLYGPEKRASALAIYTLGVSLGSSMGTILGGTIAYYFGWRVAFFAVGIPGIILALFVRFYAVEPERGLSDVGRIAEADRGPGTLLDGVRAILANRAALHLIAAVTLTSMIGYGLTSWGPTYYIRSFGFNQLEIAIYVAPILAVAGIAGTIGGGKLADYCAERWGVYAQSYMIAVLNVVAYPFLLLLYLLFDPIPALASYFVSILLQSCYLGPTFALIQGLAPLRMRAVWAAVTLLVINLIGLGIGPTGVGMLSDYLTPTYGDEALRYALLIVAILSPWPIYHYWRAGIALKAGDVTKDDLEPAGA